MLCRFLHCDSFIDDVPECFCVVLLAHVSSASPSGEHSDICPLSSAFLPDVARAIELLEKLQESGDVPGHKLQSLKKVLQSEFCTAIREVRCWRGRKRSLSKPLRSFFHFGFCLHGRHSFPADLYSKYFCASADATRARPVRRRRFCQLNPDSVRAEATLEK